MGNLNSCCCCGPTNKISNVTIQKWLRRSAVHPQTWARRIWSHRTEVHPTKDPDSIVVKKLGKEKLTSWMQVAPGTSTSDLTEETLETPGVSIDEDASLATLTGTSGVNENNVPDNCAVWAWLQKSIPDEEDLWIAKVVSVTNESDKVNTIHVTVHKEDYFGDCENSDQEVHNPSSKKSHQDPI
ncbi:uncharacterized protein LOC123840789 isoform X4 [Mirounga angustirostris]|uniref:uncharacterized protein LOC123840789 isoform X4 n=1 Tax=Mirounga angustirostris TaxID=9716 RepID=UPI00313B82BE